MDNYKYLKVFYNDKLVGTLAKTPDRLVAFEYDNEWLATGFSISPFSLPLQKKVYLPKFEPFEGLFGVFNDSLPDGWGRLLVDRLLLKNKINPSEIDNLNRLAVVQESGMGALTYKPEHRFETPQEKSDYDKLAQSLFYDIFGDPVNNEKGWNVKKLGDVCEVSSFKRVLVEDVLEKGPVPFIRGTELSAICKENKREYKMYITMEHYERVKNISGVPNVGDLLIPSINAEGLVWVVDTPEPMYYKDGRVLWVHVDQNSISPIALQRILNNLIKDNYSKITNGAVFAELNLSILRSFPIILPPLSIQNAFANKINLIEKQKAEIQSTIADLETLLASRMQYWFD